MVKKAGNEDLNFWNKEGDKNPPNRRGVGED